MVSDSILWKSAPNHLTLVEDSIHVWHLSLDAVLPHLETLRRYLSSDEMARAKRFHFRRDYERYILARWILRVLLGAYLSEDPSDLCFHYGSYEKPYLPTKPDGMNLCFNLSHSNGLVLYAMTWNQPIGIDIEFVHPITDAQEIVDRYFSASEIHILRSLPAEQKLDMFFRTWTRKEAFMKASGEGLSSPLTEFDTAMLPKMVSNMVVIQQGSQHEQPWSLIDILPAPKYTSSVVVGGLIQKVEFWEGSSLI